MTPEQRANLELSSTAFSQLEQTLSTADAKIIRDYIFEHNEWGLGMETLVDVILEQDIAISPDQKQAVLTAMSAMGLQRSQEKIRVSKRLL
ncbi:MAG: MafI family immunity protein [Pseudomonadota bacterium]